MPQTNAQNTAQDKIEMPEVEVFNQLAENTAGIAAPSYEASQVNIDPADTVENRVARMTSDPGASPLLQNAQTGAKQQAASRGMLNSAMAAGMGQKAVIETATPIASQDASMKFNEKLANQSAQNQAKSQHTSGQQALQQTAMGTQAQSFLNRENAGFEQAIQQMRGDQAKEISLIETQNQQLMQASQSASNFYAANAQALSEIMANADIPADQKQQLVDQQISLMRGGLAVIGGISNLNLTSLLDFSGSAASTGNIAGTSNGTSGGSGNGVSAAQERANRLGVPSVSTLKQLASEFGYNASDAEAESLLKYSIENNIDPYERVMTEMRAMGLA